MEQIDFLKSVVQYQERMLRDAEDSHKRLNGRYDRLDRERAMLDQQMATAAADVEKAKKDVEAAKAQLLAHEDQHKAALAEKSAADEEGNT